MNNSFVLALSVLVGTIIGGGIFGLPYVLSQSGTVPALIFFAVLGGAVMLLHLFFGEVALRTREKARLIGYARRYLGAKASWLAVVSTFSIIVGAQLAYTILGGSFLHLLLGEAMGLSPAFFSLLFWGFLSLFVLRGIQLIAKAELVMNIALLASVFVIFVFAARHVHLENFSLLAPENLFLPYGIILFALAGWQAIPEIADFFKNRKEKGNLDNVIISASAISVALYFFFALLVAGVSGAQTSPDALQGLVPFLGKGIVLLGAFFGLIAIAASFLVLGNYLKNSLRYDFKLPYLPAAGIAVLAPMLLFLLGFREFIAVLGIVGIVMGLIEGTLIVLVYAKAKTAGDRVPEYNLRLPRFIPVLVVILLVGGAAAELLFAL